MEQYNKLAEEYKLNAQRLYRLERALMRNNKLGTIRNSELSRQIEELKSKQSDLQDRLIGMEQSIGQTQTSEGNYRTKERFPCDDEQPADNVQF